MFSLKIRAPNGVHEIQMDSDTPFAFFQQKITELTQIPHHGQTLRCGYPPKLIQAAREAPISSFLRNNDAIVVAGTPSSKPAAPPPDQVGMSIGGGSAGHRLSGAPVNASDFHSLFLPNRPRPKSPYRMRAPTRPGEDRFADYHVMRREVRHDNHCCFNSIGYLLENRSTTRPEFQRQMVADVVKYNPHLYTAALLGRSNADYQAWIMVPEHWGGAIELAIFADIYQTEICSIDLQTGRMDVYGQDRRYKTRCFLCYTGTHYDPLSLSPPGNTDPSLDVTVFDSQMDAPVTARMLAFAEETRRVLARAASGGGFADEPVGGGGGRLRCGQCGRVFEDDMAAAIHASESGHSNFRKT